MGKGKEGLKFPMGNSHWEDKMGSTETANGKYATEMGAPGELKEQVNKLAQYAKKNKMKY